MVGVNPQFVAPVMAEVDIWWAVAGGWAIDLWMNDQTREHHDVEVVVRRSDQPTLHDALRHRWQLSCIDPPGSGWRTWTGDALQLPAFQLQARCGTNEFDIFTEDVDGTAWRFRRDGRVDRSHSQIWMWSRSGLPIVRPEVQLLYMARSTEPKNLRDFELTRPTLDDEARMWLAHALALTQPGHNWLRLL